MSDRTWTLQSGANLVPDGVQFDVWATNATTVDVELASGDHEGMYPMRAVDHGRFTVTIGDARVGDRYRFRLDGETSYPDPYSRFQPEGIHGASEIVDPSEFRWTDGDWDGLDAETLSIYELHVGTMTDEGTFASLERELEAIRDLGVTAVELMPVAQTPGKRNWGYDGVDLFAPDCTYGRPNDLRRLIDKAHQLGLGVILDVVYNHLGPEGAYLTAYSDDYFSDRHHTDWGAGLNWDGEGSYWVRQFATDNACYWIDEFHIDGLRLDATHAMIDESDMHIVQELTDAAREAAGNRGIVIIAEDGRHEIMRVRPVDDGGEGLDGVWADDFHHHVRVLLTNAHESYYSNYEGTTAAIADVVNHGFGHLVPSGDAPVEYRDPASVFVFCIQNHDQVGNRPFGDRMHHEINLDRYRVASALLLFVPQVPLLFMGQEFAASTPFLYFTDHPTELGKLVTEGRRREFAGFKAFDEPEMRETIPDPQARSSFLLSKLDLDERGRQHGVLELYRRMLWMRREDPVLAGSGPLTTEAIPPTAQIVVVHRWVERDHRVLIANFGQRISIPNRWLASLDERPSGEWDCVLSTDDIHLGGAGLQPEIDDSNGSLTMPARTAALFRFGGG
jgi:maltooligosyltrehalose trehalohydrolase